MEIDLNVILNIVSSMAKISVPTGVIFGIGDFIISTMFNWIFPRRKV